MNLWTNVLEQILRKDKINFVIIDPTKKVPTWKTKVRSTCIFFVSRRSISRWSVINFARWWTVTVEENFQGKSKDEPLVGWTFFSFFFFSFPRYNRSRESYRSRESSLSRPADNYVPRGETRWIGEIDRRDRCRLEALVLVEGIRGACAVKHEWAIRFIDRDRNDNAASPTALQTWKNRDDKQRWRGFVRGKLLDPPKGEKCLSFYEFCEITLREITTVEGRN